MGALSHAVLPEVGRRRLGALQVDGRRRDVDGDQGRRLSRDQKGRIGISISPQNPQIVYAMVEADSDPRAEGRAGHAEAEARERSLSLGGRRQDVEADEQLEHASVLLLAGARRSEESGSRLLLVDAVLVSNDGGKTT